LQKTTSSYDNKVDIYALGLLLVEILCPCKTDSERDRLFQDMRSDRVILPAKFIRKFPNQVTCDTVRFITYSGAFGSLSLIGISFQECVNKKVKQSTCIAPCMLYKPL